MSDAGTKNFKIKVTDTETGLSNNDVSTEVVMTAKIYATVQTLDIGTDISDQEYLVGATKLSIPAPTYTFSPADAVLNVVYSLVSAPEYVQLNSIGGKTFIEVYSSDVTITDVITIEVKTLDTESGLTMSDFFDVDVFSLREINVATQLTDVIYYVGDDEVTIKVPQF